MRTHKDLLETVREAWGWTGITPVSIVDVNSFGNLLIRDDFGFYWRLCPEDLTCAVVARDDASLNRLEADREFQMDWAMTKLVDAARFALGEVDQGRCYCLKIPGPLGGPYSVENVGTISLSELISASGSMAQQIQDLPDGGKVRLVVDGGDA